MFSLGGLLSKTEIRVNRLDKAIDTVDEVRMGFLGIGSTTDNEC